LFVDEPADQLAAAVHLQLTRRLGFQLADGRRSVTGEDGRVRPARFGERGRCYVLGLRVECRPDRAVTRIWPHSPGAGEDLVGPHRQDLLHGPGTGKQVLDRHSRASLGDLLDADADRAYRDFRGERAVRVGTAAAQDNATGRVDVEDVPVAVRLIACGPGHVVLDTTARRQIMFGEGGGVSRRPPPALELARIRPQLPNALDRCIELGLNGQREPLGILADADDGHRLRSFVSTVSTAPAVSTMSLFMRSIRARHSPSY